MNIQCEKFTIEMTHDELWQTAFNVRSSLSHTLQTHWVNHQNSWEKNEEQRLYRIKTMFSYLGRLDLYEDVFKEAKKIFEDFNKKRNEHSQ